MNVRKTANPIGAGKAWPIRQEMAEIDQRMTQLKDALQGDVAIGLQGAYVWKPQRADPEAREAESRFAEVVRLRGGGSASPTRVVLLI